ncbi:MAG: hypothetical protein PUP91_16300 [Rhizonema sp. PD37]|nr:hypothetical protein [Rhizonema sp. PD37]
MSKMFWVRNFLNPGSSLVASASIAISILSLPLLNSSKALADSYTLGTPVEVNNALQDLANKGISPSQIAFAPNGGWVIIYKGNGYISNNLRQDVLNKLSDLNKQNLTIDSIAFTPTGEWVIIYGIYGDGIATSQNLPQEAVTALSDIRTKNKLIYAIAFGPNGSFVFVYDRNSYSVSKNISPQVVADLSYVKTTRNEAVNTVAFSPDGNFIVIYDGDAYYPSQGIPKSLTAKIDEIVQNAVKNASASKIITSVGFTSDNGWTLLYHNVL